jgi:hypothetical protein
MARLPRHAPLAIALFALPAAAVAQNRYVFTLDSPMSAFTFSGTTSLGPIIGNPGNFNASGALELDLQVAGGAVTTGQFVAGNSATVIPTLQAFVPNPILPVLPPIATMTVTGAMAQFTSAQFAVAGGSFSTQVVATLVAGNATVNALGQTFALPLQGIVSSAQPISGTISHGANGFVLNVPLSGVFPFTVTAGVTGSLTITGNVRATDNALSPDKLTLSLASGGSQKMTLSAGTAFASRVYLVLGTTSGTAPGMNLGGGVTLPLNPDGWMVSSLTGANNPPFVNTVGTLSTLGLGTASLTLPPLNIPVLVGLQFNHAYVLLVGTTPVFASNAIPLTLVP